MKILHLGKYYPLKGGMEKAVLDIVEEFSGRGIQCDLLCVSTAEPGVVELNDYARIYATAAVCHANSVSISPSMIPMLRRICDQYDIIHVHCPNPMATLALYLSGYKGKVVVHWHSDILRRRISLKFYLPLQSWLIRRADVIVGTSPVYLEQSPFLQKEKAKLRTIPLGVSPVHPHPDGVRAIRERYAGRKIVFALGRLIAYKGFNHLIEAAALLPDDYVVLIGGTGPLSGQLAAQIEAAGIGHKAVLLGYIPAEAVDNYYGACDVFCLSSIWKTEAFGMVQIEAMSCAKPVVATNIPGSGVPWVNAHGVSGLNVEPENPAALAKAIVEITASDAVYEQFCERAAQRYASLFTKERMMREYHALYASLMEPEASLADVQFHPIADGVGRLSPAMETSGRPDNEKKALKIKEGLSLRRLRDKYMVVDSNSDNVNMASVYSLNEAAALLWQKLEHDDCTRSELIELLCSIYDVNVETAANDVERQLEEWSAYGLLEA